MTERRYVIWSLEHQAWWPASRWGYVDTLDRAGRFSREDAEAIVAQANIAKVHECMIPVEAVGVGGGSQVPNVDVDIHALLAQFVVAEPAAALTLDDLDRLARIGTLVAAGDATAAFAIHDYYGDLDRANRTPRAYVYLHIGMLVGTIRRPSITCPACGLTSYNPHDIEQRYCGHCHRFLDECVCRNPRCGHGASKHAGAAGQCLEPGCPCGPGGWT
jgi:hypothetical protein